MSAIGNIIIPEKELVRELDIAAPRYTSYPTIPVWDTAESDEEYRALLQQDRSGKQVSLYLHIPFCPAICHYCGCNTELLKREQQIDDYAGYLKQEIRLLRSLISQKREVVQIHFGGGTPSVLTEGQFTEILETLHDCFEFASDAELAIETNPMTCSDEKARFLCESGFNRFSIGIQDFDPEVQKQIGRFQTYPRTREFCDIVRQYDIDSLNFDLVYGLPSQNIAGLEKTLENVTALTPDRIAVYSFAYLPNMRDNQKNIEASRVPSGEDKFDLYLLTIESLQKAGYQSIGMDHFALPGDELALAHAEKRLRRNFMGYSTRPETDVIAFGATSISDFGTYYCQNFRGITDYFRAVSTSRLPVMRHVRLEHDDQLRRTVIMNLLCNGLVDKNEIENRFDITFDDYFALELDRMSDLIKKGLAELNDSSILVTALGSYFLRNIALNFDNFFDGRKGSGTTTAFSRTV